MVHVVPHASTPVTLCPSLQICMINITVWQQLALGIQYMAMPLHENTMTFLLVIFWVCVSIVMSFCS